MNSTSRPTDGRPANAGTGSVMGVVMQRELLVKLKDKTFLGTTALLLVMVAVSIAVPALMSRGNPEIKVGVVGTQAAEIGRSAADLGRRAGLGTPSPDVATLPAARLDVREVADAAKAEADVRSGALDVAIVVPASGGIELVADREVPRELKELVTEAASRTATAEQLTRAGQDPAEARRTAVALRTSAPGERLLDPHAADAMTSYFLGVAFSMVFFIANFLFGMAIAQSVVEEKQSRVVELLLAAVPVRALLAGKVAANTLLAFGQVLLLLAVGAVAAAATGNTDVMNLVLSAGGPFLVFFVLGFIMYATMWAACGALASRQEDLQATIAPMQILMYVPLFATLYLTQPGPFLRILSYVPFSSPLAMPRRLMMGDGAWWEAVLSGALVLVTAGLLVAVSARIYERNILKTAGRIAWREALRA